VFCIVITERGGAQRQLDFDAPELSVGRLEDNDVVLPRTNVSKRHARLVLKDDRYVLIDLKSTNGTYLNGRRIAAPMMVGAGDKIYIGDFILALQDTPKLQAAQRRLRDRGPTQPVSSVRPAVSEPLSEPGLGALGALGPVVHDPRPRRSTPPPPPPRQTAPAPSTRLPPPATPLAPSPLPAPPGRLPAAPDARPTLSELPVSHWPTGPEHRPASEQAISVEIDEADDEPLAEPSAQLSAEPIDEPAPAEPVPAERAQTERPRFGSGPALARVTSAPPRVQDPDSGPATSPAVLAPSVRLQGALQTLMERLAGRMDLAESHERAFPSEQQATLEALIDDLARDGVIGPDLDRRFLTQAAISEAVGLGPLDRLLTNRSVREVVVDGPSRILADLGGGLSPVSSFFSSSQAVHTVLRRLCARAGKKLTGAAVEEVQLPDGSQVQVLMPPLSPSGPLISIRCPLRTATSPDGLITEGVLSIDMLNLLRTAMQRRLNTLVVGPMTAGVSTLLAAIAALCQDHERIVTLQEAPSLAIHHPHVLPLSLAGSHGKSLDEVLRYAARLRADRLVIDDLRGKDALSALLGASAMRGVLVGMHAPSPAAALEQLEMFAQVALGGSRASLATLIAQAFQLLVHVSLDPNGARRVLSIAEVRGSHDGVLELTTLYRYDGGFKSTEQRAGFLAG
jgi:pilus assembly protein CpaF